MQRVKLLNLAIAFVATVPRPLVAKRLQTFPLLLILSSPFLCIGLLAIAISHRTSLKRGGLMFHTSSEAQYKTTLKLASFSEQDPDGVLPVQGTLVYDEPPSCDTVAPLCWEYSCRTTQVS